MGEGGFVRFYFHFILCSIRHEHENIFRIINNYLFVKVQNITWLLIWMFHILTRVNKFLQFKIRLISSCFIRLNVNSIFSPIFSNADASLLCQIGWNSFSNVPYIYTRVKHLNKRTYFRAKNNKIYIVVTVELHDNVLLLLFISRSCC